MPIESTTTIASATQRGPCGGDGLGSVFMTRAPRRSAGACDRASCDRCRARPRRRRLLPSYGLEHAQDVAALDLLERAARRSGRGLERAAARRGSRGCAPADPRRRGAAREPSRPRARSRCAARARCPATRSAGGARRPRRDSPRTDLSNIAREVIDEVLREQEHVAGAHAQRRQRDVDDVDAVVEVLAELAVLRPSPRGRGWSRRRAARRSRPRPRRRSAARGAPGARAAASAGSRAAARRSRRGTACRRRPARAGPVRAAFASVNAPARVTEQLALDQRLGNRARSRPRRTAQPCAATAGGASARPSPCRCRDSPVISTVASVGPTCSITS